MPTFAKQMRVVNLQGIPRNSASELTATKVKVQGEAWSRSELKRQL